MKRVFGLETGDVGLGGQPSSFAANKMSSRAPNQPVSQFAAREHGAREYDKVRPLPFPKSLRRVPHACKRVNPVLASVLARNVVRLVFPRKLKCNRCFCFLSPPWTLA